MDAGAYVHCPDLIAELNLLTVQQGERGVQDRLRIACTQHAVDVLRGAIRYVLCYEATATW